MATTKKPLSKKTSPTSTAHRFEPVKIESLFLGLDAIAWMEGPSAAQVAQFAGIDPRTAGKLLKNAQQIGLIDIVAGGYVMLLPYPFKGDRKQKEAVVREALVKMPLLTGVRQFLRLGDLSEVALRKASTIVGISPFNPADLNPLLEWARSLGALKPELVVEDLVDAAESQKEVRHREQSGRRIAFLSHSSHDKPFMRQLAGDLTSNGVDVWLDEQRIRVGDSIPEKIAQGLAESDYFLIGVSRNSVESAWVKKELNNALVEEVGRRKVQILPLKLDESKIPGVISDKKYADFSKSYKAGLEDLLNSLKADVDV